MFEHTPVEKHQAASEKLARCVIGIYALSAQIDGAMRFLDRSLHSSIISELEQFKALLNVSEKKLLDELVQLQSHLKSNS